MLDFKKSLEGKRLKLSIWVDDEREAPKGYDYSFHSVGETLFTIGRFISLGDMGDSLIKDKMGGYPDILLDLDHDAGEYVGEGGDYIAILKILSQPWAEPFFTSGNRRPLQVRLHSANPVGVENMRAIIESTPWMKEVK